MMMESDIRYLMQITADHFDQRTPKLREASAIVLFVVLQRYFLEAIAIPNGELRGEAIKLFAAKLERTWLAST